ncbi:MAG TPA: beta-phosphoglucomutase [Cyclobacteriaceae bacterium]|nr:beta-phosphoglucomutase [Cyclobacteriaceae bacterium]
MIRACIFDLDGVIVDTAHYHYLAWKRLANELGFDLTKEQNENLKGVSRRKSLEILLAIGGLTVSESEKERLAFKKNEWFNDFIERMLPEEIFPGVRPLIDRLKFKGIKVALASSSKNARTVIRRLQIENMFEVIVDGNMINHTKPDPEIFLRTAQLIEVLPPECLVFEDAEAGVEAALAAGMKCVGVGSIDRLGKANMVIDKTGDFRVEMLIGF